MKTKKTTVILIERHERLLFENSQHLVMDFLKKRLRHFGFKNICEMNSIQKHDVNVALEKYDFVVTVTALNPFIDPDIISDAQDELLEFGAQTAVVKGAIPGTEFNKIYYSRAPENNRHTFHTDSQEKHNSQFNLFKYKRLKLFLDMSRTFPETCNLRTEELISFFAEKHKFFLRNGSEDIKLKTINQCPHCGSKRKQKLKGNASQPMIGFVNVNKTLYEECLNCGLIYMPSYIPATANKFLYDNFDAQDQGIATENLDETGMRINQRMILNMMDDLLCKDAKILDLGGGAGRWSYEIKRHNQNWDVHHSDIDIKQHHYLSEVGVKSRFIDFVNGNIPQENFDLITAIEVIEHVDFEAFRSMLNKVQRALKKGGHFIFTTPDYDSPLCRGFDYFNCMAPQHQLVFRRSWLESYFEDSKNGFRIFSSTAGGELFESLDSFFHYYENTCPTDQYRSLASILKLLLKNEANQKLLFSKHWGSEVIMVLENI